MEKKLLFFLSLFFFLSLSHMIYGQNEGNVWYFGSNAGLDFNSGIPISIAEGQIDSNEGAAVISDSNGQLLFYTDGENVWNKNHTLMPNGQGLKGSTSSSQAAIIIPKPGSSTLYYIFTCDESGHANGLRFSVVDMSLDGGKGDVTGTKNILLATPVCEKLTAVKKNDESGYWVISHSFGNNKFLVFSVGSSGVNTEPIVSSVGLPVLETVQTVGHLKVSPDGTKLVSCSFKQKLELFNFDASTGIISNARILNDKSANYGAEFSGTGNVLYITTGNNSYVYDLVQYDLTVANIPASEINLKTNTPYQFGALQLGPDGRIYATIINSNYIAFIDQPEIIGAGCNFIKNGLHLGAGTSTFGLPQFIQSYFDSREVVQLVCSGNEVAFGLPSELNVTSAFWDFGDGNTSNQISSNHIYVLPGTYDAMVSAQANTGSITKKWQVIVSEVPVLNRVHNQIVCGTSTAAYTLKKNDITLLGTQNPGIFRIDYFLSEANANNHSNPLPSIYNLPLGTTTFYAKIYNTKNIQCYQITSFTVTLVDQLAIGQVSGSTLCGNSSTNYREEFDLSTKNSEVLNGLNANQFTITYHSSQTNADNKTDALPYLYTNTFPEEIIYVRLENNDNSTCFATTSFPIRVVEQPIIPVLSSLQECGDLSGNETAIFDLTQKTTEILGNLSPNLFNVTYHVSLTDANNNANAIISPYTNTINNQTIYVNITAVGGVCKTTGSFALVVNPLPKIHSLQDIKICDNDNDGHAIFDFSIQTAALLAEQIHGQYNVTYHLSLAAAENNLNSLPIQYQNISNPQTIYTRIDNILNQNCFEIIPFKIHVDSLPTVTKPDNIALCSNEVGGNLADVDLHIQDSVILNGQSDIVFSVSYYTTLENAITKENPLIGNFQNTISPQLVFARVDNINNFECYAITDFEVIVFSKPMVEMNEVYSVCKNDTLVISAPSGFDHYQWSNGATTQSISVNDKTHISLTVNKNYGPVSCDNTIHFDVIKSSLAVIKEVKINDWTENQNFIEIITKGDGDYEYSIDGENYQESPYFYGLEIGHYTVYVRDKNECGVVFKEIYLLVYPKYFTPNGDGLHENWQIKLAESEPDLKVSIFDKYGKLVASFDGRSEGWDGTSNNIILPSADYWFVVERKSGIIYRGHFALLR